MANTSAVVVRHEEFTRQQSERLGTKISDLCSYIYAAEHRLLILIREFDEQKGWEWLGFPHAQRQRAGRSRPSES